MDENQIKVTFKNTANGSQNRIELIAIGGKSQTPCLVINGKAMYESDDIIDWLKNNLKK